MRWCWALGTSSCSCAGRLLLQAYPKEHPFAQLSGSDNVISFSSRRYSQQPLIIRYLERALHHVRMEMQSLRIPSAAPMLHFLREAHQHTQIHF